LKWVGAAGIAATILLVLGLMSFEQRLEICRWETGETLFSIQIEEGSEFSLWFLHSYDRAFFQEHYRLEKEGRILLTHLTFKSCLNGQGFEEGVYRALSDGTAELSGINKELREVRFRLGSRDLANHTLIVGEKRIPLLDYAETGEVLCIRPIYKSRWQAFLETKPKIRSVYGGSPS
jgi:hypothetical protein